MSRNPVEPDFEGLDALAQGSCVHLSAEEVEAYDATERMMSHREFRRHFTRAQYNALSALFKYELDPRSGLTLKNDWHIRYGWGYLNGRKVVCIHHSSIHNFYLAKVEQH